MSPKYVFPQAPGGAPTTRGTHWLWIAAAASLVLAAFDLIEPIVNLPLRVPRNFNEGWNAYWAVSAASGGQLYPPLDAAVSNNYPPASFFFVGFLSRLGSDPILAGRAVAFASFLIVAINIVIWLRSNAVRTPVALLSGAAFVMTLDALAHGSIGTDDPQWLAHALATTGLVILWRTPRLTSRVACAAAFMMLGEWVKHLVIALPAATLAWLWRVDRRALGKWLAVGGALGAIFLAAVLARYGKEFLEGVLHAPRRILLGRSVLMTYSALPALFPILCIAALSLRRFHTAEAPRFAVLYLAISCVIAGFVSSGDGVAENAFYDVAIAAALAGGLALEDMLRAAASKQSSQRLGKAAVLLATAIFSVWLPFGVYSNIERFKLLAARNRATPGDIAFLRQHNVAGVACENLSLCFWAGAPFNVDFFNFGQKLKTGRIRLDNCTRLFDGRHYPVLQLYSAPTDADSRLPALCNRVIAAHYEVVRMSINGVFLAARTAFPSSRESAR